MKNGKILFILLCFFVLSSNVYADISKEYECDKTYVFGAMDYNSELVKKLYDIDNASIPKKYSLRDVMDIPVANQMNLGLCDTFATVKSIETNYALTNKKYIDLSERYLDYMTSNHFYNVDRHVGSLENGEEGDGSSSLEVISIAQAIGVPKENDVPYKDYNGNDLNIIRNAKSVIRVKEIVHLPRLDIIDNEKVREEWLKIVKLHIMKYGSVNTAIWAPSNGYYFNYDTYAYREPPSDVDVDIPAGGHAVSIVGWDDSYSKKNFNYKPKKDGAFILLNSWGDDWGDKGYFYMSYEDVGQLLGVISTEEIKNEYQEYSNGNNIKAMEGYILNQRFVGIKFDNKSEGEYLSHLVIGGGQSINPGEKFCTSSMDSNGKIKNECVLHDIGSVKIYLNPKDGSFDKDKLIYIGKTSSIPGGNFSFYLDKPISLEGKSFSLVFEFIGENDIINLLKSFDDKGNPTIGNIYLANSLDEEYIKGYEEFPIHVYTTKNVNNISKIEMDSIAKSKYKIDQELELKNSFINVIYEDGTSKRIELTDSNIRVENYDKTKLGKQTLTVKYYDYETTMNIEVVDSSMLWLIAVTIIIILIIIGVLIVKWKKKSV